MAPCISLSYLSTSALVYFNSVINTLVFSNSNPFLRLISLSFACVMVSAVVQLTRALLQMWQKMWCNVLRTS